MTDRQIIDGKYQVVRLLGQGGMGAVYEAQHLGTGRRVALKVIVAEALARGGSDVFARFEREARASGSIDSEHVVQVLDTGVDPVSKNPYMVMELLAGEDVQQLVARLGALAPDLALRICAQACVGLGRAHQAGIVHRDIKTANIFLSRSDRGEALVKLLDFGIAKVRSDQFGTGENHALTRTGSMMGSPLYMSPEQARGSKAVDARSDIWSMGVVMYEVLTGATPNGHCETIGDLIIAICSERTRPLQDRAPWVAPQIAAIVHKALASNPEKRFQTTAEMHAAIVSLLPSGLWIGEQALTPMPVALRSHVAARYVMQASPDSSGRISPFAATADPTTTRLADDGTALGAGQITGAQALPRQRSAWPWTLLVAAAASIAGGVTFYRLRAPHLQHVTSDTAAAVAPSASIAAPTSASSAAAPESRTVLLAVGPSDAKIEIDGVSVPIRDGKVGVSGATGTVHHVRVFVGSRETKADVTIAETGAVPARVDAPPQAPTRQIPGAAHPTPPSVSPPSAAAPPIAVTPKPGGSPTSPAIDRGM